MVVRKGSFILGGLLEWLDAAIEFLPAFNRPPALPHFASAARIAAITAV